jgi:Ca2+-binding RTX toxin-like protein
VLVGSAGGDLMIGGRGNDTYEVTEAEDSVVELAGGGTDVVFSYLNSYTLAEEVEILLLAGSAVTGIGNGLNNRIIGSSGDNVLEGGAGDDVLIGLGGADRMVGGAGDDTYEVTEAGDLVVEAAGGGRDTVFSYLESYGLAAEVETLVLAGSAVTGVGNALDNALFGNAGSNVLVGGGGNDRLEGGDGDDTLNGEAGSDQLVGGAGRDSFWFVGVNAGQDRISDFSSADDTIVLDRAMFGDFAGVQARWAQVGQDVVITHESGATLTLEQTSLAQLNSSDFVFVS